MNRNVKCLLVVILSVVVSSCTSAELIRASQNTEMEKSMIKVKAEVIIDAPIEVVWGIVGENFEQNSKFNINAKETLYLKEVKGGVGSQRRTINHEDKIIDVEIIEFDEEKKYVKWEIFNQNVAPMVSAFSSYSLSADKNGNTVLVQDAAFKMKIFFMDWVAKMKFPKMFKTELAAIKHLAETGKSITKKNAQYIADRNAGSVRMIE